MARDLKDSFVPVSNAILDFHSLIIRKDKDDLGEELISIGAFVTNTERIILDLYRDFKDLWESCFAKVESRGVLLVRVNELKKDFPVLNTLYQTFRVKKDLFHPKFIASINTHIQVIVKGIEEIEKRLKVAREIIATEIKDYFAPVSNTIKELQSLIQGNFIQERKDYLGEELVNMGAAVTRIKKTIWTLYTDFENFRKSYHAKVESRGVLLVRVNELKKYFPVLNAIYQTFRTKKDLFHPKFIASINTHIQVIVKGIEEIEKLLERT